MKIKLYCCFYNEAFLIPFFLNHYNWVDQIEALVSESSDKTLELLAQSPNVIINPVYFPDGLFDDQLKTQYINAAINESPFDADWHLVVDSDEFVWPQGRPDATRYEVSGALQEARDAIVIYAQMWTVFRHHTDRDLDPYKPPALQRRHGIAEPTAIEFINGKKPVFTRPGLGINYTVGQHGFVGMEAMTQSVLFEGAHWTNADPCFCVKRRVNDRSPRLSADNHKIGLGFHNFELTEAHVLEECARHMNDPLCF